MKSITRKWYWYTVLLLIYGALCILDIVLTLIAINVPYSPFYEANPIAVPFVNNPNLLYITTFLAMFLFWAIGFVLWLIDEKTEKFVDLITFVVMFVLLISTIVRLIVVINNMFQIYFWLR